MTDRTDPMYYDLDIEEIATGKISKAQVACWWSGEHSINGIHRMCDCQMGGYFGIGGFGYAQYNYLQAHKCDHRQPSKKFVAVRAYLPSGETVSL